AAAARDLHAFPPRRSSDLAGRVRGREDDRAAQVWAVEVVGVPQAGAAGGGRCAAAAGQRPVGVDGGVVQRVKHLDDDGMRAIGRDRKSTRLNSSHVKISYA